MLLLMKEHRKTLKSHMIRNSINLGQKLWAIWLRGSAGCPTNFLILRIATCHFPIPRSTTYPWTTKTSKNATISSIRIYLKEGLPDIELQKNTNCQRWLNRSNCLTSWIRTLTAVTKRISTITNLLRSNNKNFKHKKKQRRIRNSLKQSRMTIFWI